MTDIEIAPLAESAVQPERNQRRRLALLFCKVQHRAEQILRFQPRICGIVNALERVDIVDHADMICGVMLRERFNSQ